jgi:hypothetical protein
MRRAILTVGVLLMGLALVGGAAVSLAGPSLSSLDQQVGTHGSAAGAVLGLGLIAAAFNPPAHLGWVRAGAAYGFVLLAFELGSYFLWHTTFHIGPVFFGLAFSLLLIAAYPQRRDLVPSRTEAGKKAAQEPEGKPSDGDQAKESG